MENIQAAGGDEFFLNSSNGMFNRNGKGGRLSRLQDEERAKKDVRLSQKTIELTCRRTRSGLIQIRTPLVEIISTGGVASLQLPLARRYTRQLHLFRKEQRAVDLSISMLKHHPPGQGQRLRLSPILAES
jgi:hypothetical protein